MKESTKLIIAISVGLFGMTLLINGLFDKKNNQKEETTTETQIEEQISNETTTSSTTTTTITKTTKKALKTTKKKNTTKVSTASRQDYINYAKEYSNYDDTQMSCLITLWDYESNWNPNIVNSKGACGIPQALPCNKIKKQQGSNDWKAQIRWGVNYINYRYKTPCSALNHFKKKNWY